MWINSLEPINKAVPFINQNKSPHCSEPHDINPLPDDKFLILRKKFADDYFKFDENGRKLSKRVENTVEKGEIARYKQFLLFPQCFQKAYFPGAQKVSLCGNGLKETLKFYVGC